MSGSGGNDDAEDDGSSGANRDRDADESGRADRDRDADGSGRADPDRGTGGVGGANRRRGAGGGDTTHDGDTTQDDRNAEHDDRNAEHDDGDVTHDDGAAATHDGAAAALGVGASAMALVGATGPYRAGADDAIVLAGIALAIIVLVGFLARRYDLLPRRAGTPAIAAASLALVLVGTYALNRGIDHSVGSPVPALLVTVAGAGLAIGAAGADYRRVSARGIARRAAAVGLFSVVAVTSLFAMAVWGTIVGGLVLPLSIGETLWDLPETSRTVVSQAITVLSVGTIAVGYLAVAGRDRSFVDLKVPTLRDLGYVVGGIFALLGAAVAIDLLLATAGAESADHSSFDRARGNPEMLLVLVVASIVVIGPFEELLYRNVIQKSLYAYFSRSGAVVAASVPFAVVHLPAYWGGHFGQSLVSLGVVLALSLILGAIYERTENLLVPALVHGAFNAVVYYNAYVGMAG